MPAAGRLTGWLASGVGAARVIAPDPATPAGGRQPGESPGRAACAQAREAATTRVIAQPNFNRFEIPKAMRIVSNFILPEGAPPCKVQLNKHSPAQNAAEPGQNPANGSLLAKAHIHNGFGSRMLYRPHPVGKPVADGESMYNCFRLLCCSRVEPAAGAGARTGPLEI